MTTKPENVAHKICSKCEEAKTSEEFYKRGLICCECNNSRRRQKYKENEENITVSNTKFLKKTLL